MTVTTSNPTRFTMMMIRTWREPARDARVFPSLHDPHIRRDHFDASIRLRGLVLLGGRSIEIRDWEAKR